MKVCARREMLSDTGSDTAVDGKNILILGIGNLLLGDEGVGIHAVRALEEMEVPENVEVVDGGTGGFELLNHFRGRKKVIIIDAMNGDAEPGTIIRCVPNDLDLQWHHPYSSHQCTITELLYVATAGAPEREVVLFGIIPKDTHHASTQLSKEVNDRIPHLVSAVLQEIHS